MSYTVSSSHTFATTPERAWDVIVEAPLQSIFNHRSGPIPAVKDMQEEEPWGRAGAVRTVLLADGTSNLESLISASRPDDYRYELTAFTGPMKALVSKVEGRFDFQPQGDQTVATWTWVLHPTNAITGLALPVLGFFWKGWANKMWPKFASRI
ncbi:MAG: SRPBCC family protein [Marmoricola sp.]